MVDVTGVAVVATAVDAEVEAEIDAEVEAEVVAVEICQTWNFPGKKISSSGSMSMVAW